jgi:hypothetical protein
MLLFCNGQSPIKLIVNNFTHLKQYCTFYKILILSFLGKITE